MLAALTALLILAGSCFLLVGSWGLVRLPGLMQRLHAPTLSATLGVGALLLAAMLHAWTMQGTLSLHELLITLFLFLSAPVSAQMLAKARLLRSPADARRLPPTGRPVGWATLDPVAADVLARTGPVAQRPTDTTDTTALR